MVDWVNNAQSGELISFRTENVFHLRLSGGSDPSLSKPKHAKDAPQLGRSCFRKPSCNLSSHRHTAAVAKPHTLLGDEGFPRIPPLHSLLDLLPSTLPPTFLPLLPPFRFKANLNQQPP